MNGYKYNIIGGILWIVLWSPVQSSAMENTKNRKRSFLSTNEKKKKDETRRRQIKQKQLQDWHDSLVEIELMSNHVDILQDKLNGIRRDYFLGSIGSELNLAEYTRRKILEPSKMQPVEIELKEITDHIKIFNESFATIKKNNEKNK
jgi:hypothetical protein